MERRGQAAWRDSGEGCAAGWDAAALGRRGERGQDWQSGSLASLLVVSTVAVRRQQAADNFRAADLALSKFAFAASRLLMVKF